MGPPSTTPLTALTVPLEQGIPSTFYVLPPSFHFRELPFLLTFLPLLAMEKSSAAMSLDEWELLPDTNSFFAFGHHHKEEDFFIDPKVIIHTDYFLSPPQPKETSTPAIAHENPVAEKAQEDDPLHEFKDISMDSNQEVKVSAEIRGIKQINDDDGDEGVVVCKAEVEEAEEQNEEATRTKSGWEWIGLSVWRWRVSGIGALCSAGVAAAIWGLMLGGRQRQKQHQQQYHQRIQFQMYADDKRIKQVVQQASRLNQAMSAVRGAPMTRASISFGGYFDGL